MDKNVYQTLQDWHELLKSGAITETEFTARKNELLGTSQKKNNPNQNEELIRVLTPEEQAQSDAEYEMLFNSKNWFEKKKGLVIGLSIAIITGFTIWYLINNEAKSTNVLNNSNNADTFVSDEKENQRKNSVKGEKINRKYKLLMPKAPKDDKNSFKEFTAKHLIRLEYLEADDNNIWYGENHYLYGVITSVDNGFTGFKIYIVETSKEFKSEFRSITDEVWDVSLDEQSYVMDDELEDKSGINFRKLITTGRRLKFSMTEGFPGGGTAANGLWFLTYAKALDGNSF